MILEKVILRNFLSHKETEVAFQDGITVLIGPNGAGKSAILDAISFALFKEHSRGRTLETLIRRGSSSAEVTLRFRVNGKRYIVSRRILKIGRSVKCEAFLHCCEGNRTRLIARGERAVNTEITKILGIDRSTFINAIYVRQGEIDRLVTSQAHERKRVISKLLGLDDLEKAWKLIREIILDYEKEKTKLESILSERDKVIVEIGEIKKELMHIQEELKRRELELVNLEELLGKYKRELETLEQRKRTYERLTLSLKLLEQEVRNLSLTLEEKEGTLREIAMAEKRLEELKNVDVQLKDLEGYYAIKRELTLINEKRDSLLKELNDVLKAIEIVRNLGNCQREYKKLNEEKEMLIALLERKTVIEKLVKEKSERIRNLSLKIEKKVKTLERHISQISSEFGIGLIKGLDEFVETLRNMINDYEKLTKNLNDKLNELKRESEVLAHTLREVRTVIEKLEKSEGKCPLCGSKLTERKRLELLKKYEKLYEEAVERAHQIESMKEEIFKKIRESTSFLNKLRNVNINELLAINNNVERLREQLSDEERALKELVQEYQRLNTMVNKNKIEYLNERIAALEEDYKRYVIAESVLKKSDKEKLEKEIEFLSSRIEELRSKIATFEIKFGKMSIEELEEHIEELKELKSEYDRLLGIVSYKEELVKELDNLRKIIKEKKNIIDDIKSQVGELMYDNQKYQMLKNEIEVIEAKRSELISITSKLRERYSLLSERLQSLRSRLRDIETTELELKRIVRFLNILEGIRKLYSKDGLQRKIRALARPLIESYTRNLFLMFGLDYDDLKIDEDYEVTLVGSGGEQRIDSISGGEKTALALALRLSLARVLTGSTLEFMMLDEPTVNMDESRRRELIRMLKRISEGEGVVPQLIVVTHDQEIEEAADLVYLVRKENGISKVYVQGSID